MSEKDDIFPGLPTGGSDFGIREAEEQADRDSLQRELNEQSRISGEQTAPFEKNRVTPPGSGDGAGGRVRVNRDHWAE